jgi:xylulokinase
MSFLGIDVGTSALKACVYREDGRLLGSARVPVDVRRAKPGWQERDPEHVWDATVSALRSLAEMPEMQADPIEALAVSASGDEVFPIDAGGRPLASAILSGDIRGSVIAAETLRCRSVLDWHHACGHVPERMDPINRYLWLTAQAPAVMAQADRLVGWHEFLTLRLAGRAVVDRSLASKWAVFDIATGGWSAERVKQFDLDERLLPEILPWRTIVGAITSSTAAITGLPVGAAVCVGGYDASCSALGGGVSGPSAAGLACGSWEVIVAPFEGEAKSHVLADARFSMIPHPDGNGVAAVAQSPNGTAVPEWASNLVKLPLDVAQAHLAGNGPGPGALLAVPHLSGALAIWSEPRESRGALIGLTLGTQPIDILQALLEAVGYELTIMTRRLSDGGVPIRVLRATGGGSRSAWWMQLKADLTGIPVEIVAQDEPGAFGAALLAMDAVTPDRSVSGLCETLTRVIRRYEPSAERRELHRHRLDRYASLVETLVSTATEAP